MLPTSRVGYLVFWCFHEFFRFSCFLSPFPLSVASLENPANRSWFVTFPHLTQIMSKFVDIVGNNLKRSARSLPKGQREGLKGWGLTDRFSWCYVVSWRSNICTNAQILPKFPDFLLPSRKKRNIETSWLSQGLSQASNNISYMYTIIDLYM